MFKGNKFKVLAGLLAFMVLSAVGFAQEAQARVGTLPSSQGSRFSKFVYIATAAKPHYANANATGDTLVTTGSTIVVGNTLFGFSVTATTSNQVASIYDENEFSAIDQSLESSDMVDEIGEATQYDTAVSDWVAPYRLDDGFTLSTTGACTVTVQFT